VRAGPEWLVEIESAERQPARPELVLAVAAGDRERFTWMAEKAVEIGVTGIVPLDTARSVGVASRLRGTHTAKLQRVVLEATKQCGAAWAPKVLGPVPLAEFIARPVEGAGWLADVAGETPPAHLEDKPLTVIIGPEGGFTGEERAAILSAGYQPVVLGSNTLRFETAALAAAMSVVTARMRGKDG
jgi:16S rRNA (uracil1498-N3)-methyltransferase